jgi:hypothetical protein
MYKRFDPFIETLERAYEGIGSRKGVPEAIIDCGVL